MTSHSTPSGTAPTRTDGVVTIRAHRPEDEHGVVEQSADPSSQRWTRVPVPYSMDDAHQFVDDVIPRGWATDSEWTFAIEVDGRYGGTISLRNEGEGVAEIAFGSHPAIRGTGAVERALRLLLAWGFEERELRTVVWRANVGNWASRKVAWRLGFSFDGTVRQWLPQRGELRDGWVGTLLRDEPHEPRSEWLEAPLLIGEGVCLRPFEERDLDRIVEGSDDPLTQFWLAFLPGPYTRADGVDYLEQVTERLATATGVTWAVTESPDGPLLGTAGLFRLKSEREAEAGYWMHPEGRGRGLTARAAELAIRHGFETLGLDRVTAYVSEPNVASRRVVESLGLRQCSVDRRAARTRDGAAVDLVGYDVLASEFAPRT